MQVKSKRLAVSAPLAVLMLLVALVLAACGDPTATPAPTSTPVPPTATPAPPTATPAPAPTTAAPTTAAAVATTAASGGAAATTAASGGAAAGNVTLPTIKGVSEVPLNQAIVSELLKQLPSGLNNSTVKFYVSDDDAETAANNADAAFTAAGYSFGIPGTTKPTKQGDTIVGFYVKAGTATAPDILLAGTAVPADPGDVGKNLNIPGLDAAAAQQLVNQIKGKKSILVVIAAPGLLQNLLGGGGLGASGSSTAATSTTAATRTTAATSATTAAVSGGTSGGTTGGDVGESDVPVYTGAKRVDSVSGSIGGLTSVYYVSSDDYSKITGWAKKAFEDKGWTEVQTFESNGATVVTGKKGKFSMLGTIVGPQARGQASFDNIFKQAGAGTNDTVIAIVITAS